MRVAPVWRIITANCEGNAELWPSGEQLRPDAAGEKTPQIVVNDFLCKQRNCSAWKAYQSHLSHQQGAILQLHSQKGRVVQCREAPAVAYVALKFFVRVPLRPRKPSIYLELVTWNQTSFAKRQSLQISLTSSNCLHDFPFMEAEWRRKDKESEKDCGRCFLLIIRRNIAAYLRQSWNLKIR